MPYTGTTCGGIAAEAIVKVMSEGLCYLSGAIGLSLFLSGRPGSASVAAAMAGLTGYYSDFLLAQHNWEMNIEPHLSKNRKTYVKVAAAGATLGLAGLSIYCQATHKKAIPHFPLPSIEFKSI